VPSSGAARATICAPTAAAAFDAALLAFDAAFFAVLSTVPDPRGFFFERVFFFVAETSVEVAFFFEAVFRSAAAAVVDVFFFFELAFLCAAAAFV